MNKNNKGGRPIKRIDWHLVETMLEGGSTGGDIADVLGMNRDHFYRRVRLEKGIHLSIWQAQCKAITRHRLRVAQIKAALGYQYEKTEIIYEDRPDGSRVAVGSRITVLHQAPNAAMLIFLGKNMLGQREMPEGDGTNMFGNIPNYRLVGDDEKPDKN